MKVPHRLPNRISLPVPYRASLVYLDFSSPSHCFSPSFFTSWLFPYLNPFQLQ
jgi:hypothetical protein